MKHLVPILLIVIGGFMVYSGRPQDEYMMLITFGVLIYWYIH